ncbi:MAG TPA: hypothetical protein VMT70_05680 [Vicinamibacteria bacterium]|nr:hypothetical protein [Vicinamibacteria bacterium]
MRSPRGAVLGALLLAACRSHDPAKELAVSGVETYWIVDSPQQGQNYVAPAVRFRLKNVGPETIGSIQARARFPAPDQDEVWGSIQEQVSTWSRPLERGREVVVTVRSAGRYHSPADPEDMLRSPGFKDPRVEVFVRIGSSNWALLAQSLVTRRIGAPEVHDLVGGR